MAGLQLFRKQAWCCCRQKTGTKFVSSRPCWSGYDWRRLRGWISQPLLRMWYWWRGSLGWPLWRIGSSPHPQFPYRSRLGTSHVLSHRLDRYNRVRHRDSDLKVKRKLTHSTTKYLPTSKKKRMDKINAGFFATLRKRKIEIIEENKVRNVKFYRQSMNNQLFRFSGLWEVILCEGYSRFVELRMESAHLCPAKHTWSNLALSLHDVACEFACAVAMTANALNCH